MTTAAVVVLVVLFSPIAIALTLVYLTREASRVTGAFAALCADREGLEVRPDEAGRRTQAVAAGRIDGLEVRAVAEREGRAKGAARTTTLTLRGGGIRALSAEDLGSLSVAGFAPRRDGEVLVLERAGFPDAVALGAALDACLAAVDDAR